ncbi:MAG: phosphate signaling complex PhoU family protein, partial [Lutimaribacter sp.]
MQDSTQHIVSAFDRELEAIQARIMKMGGLVENAILEGARSLDENDTELAEQVRDGDKAIDALELLINEDVTRLIALRSPTAVDLRIVLSVMKISGNLERIGDYAKNMAKRTGVLANMAPIEGGHAASAVARRLLERIAGASAAEIADAIAVGVGRTADR